MTLTTETVPLPDLHPYHRNPRRGNVAAIAESLRESGQYRAIVVNVGTYTGRPYEVLAGNHTVEAARSLGWAALDAHLVDVDDDAAARIVLADNRTSDHGTYDNDALLDLLSSLDSLAGTGYDDTDLDDLLVALEAPATPQPAAPEQDYNEGGRGQFEALERKNAARRLLLFDLPTEAFAWMVEHLEQVAQKYGVGTNVEAVALLVERDLDVTAPPMGEQVGR